MGFLQTYSRALDLLSKVLHVVILWGGLAFAYRFHDIAWDYHGSILFLSSILSYFFCADVVGLYSPMRNQKLPALLYRTLLAVTGAMVGAALTYIFFLSEHLNLALGFWWSWLSLCTGLSLLLRTVLYGALSLLRKSGRNTRRAVIVGDGQQLIALLERLEANPWMGITLVGIYTNTALENNLPILGSVQQALDADEIKEQDYIYIALPMREADFIERLTEELLDSTATVVFVPDIFSFQLMNSQQGAIDGLPLFTLVDRPQSLMGSFLKRLFDIAFAGLALLLLAVPMLLIALAIKIDSKGPVIFKQRRYGMDGRAIDVWKFRTMRVLENGEQVKQAQRNDPRITKVGAFLRRTSLDELPQFINVLQGSMSVVGPRPHAVAHNELYRKQIKGYMLRHKVKPGITGLAQVNGCRGETDTLEKMQARIDYDLEYLRQWSLWLDIKIVMKTVAVGFVGENAY